MYLKYVGFKVTNLERSLKFYAENLGLREVRRGDLTKHGMGIWVLLEDPISSQRLGLNWYPKGSQFDVSYTVGEGLDHIGFVVNDVEATYHELLAKGAEPTGVDPKETDGWTAYLKDPDGNWVEIYQVTEPRRL